MTLLNPNEPSNRLAIAKAVLDDTDMSDVFKPEEATEVRVGFSDLTGNGRKDALVTVNFGPEATLMAVYTPVTGGYDFIGEVGYFYGVDNITFIRPENAPEDIIIFRERNNQTIGARERSSFIRGYAYKNDKFVNVISLDENIESWWNEGYPGNAPVWSKVVQTSNVDNSNPNLITTSKTQVYSQSDAGDGKTKPNDDEFVEKKRRVVDEQYSWSDKWNAYILYEKVEKATGKTVAVLQDYAMSPYVLTGDNFDKYKILREDGTVAIVDHSALEDFAK